MSYLLTAVGALKSVQLGFPVWIVVLSFLKKNIYIYIDSVENVDSSHAEVRV